MADIGSSASGSPLVFAVDYDRTLTGNDLSPSEEALAAIASLRVAGIRCFLVTGRSQADLALHPTMLTAFDGYCLEGGAQWGTWGNFIGPSNANIALAAAGRLEAAGIVVQRRVASFSCAKAYLDSIRMMAADCSIQVNHDRVDVLPPGLDKAIGLDAVLGQALIRGAHVVALGDGENDIPFLQAAEVGLAVANAVPELKAVADEVLVSAGPAGVVEVARRLLKGDWQDAGRDPPVGPAGGS